MTPIDAALVAVYLVLAAGLIAAFAIYSIRCEVGTLRRENRKVDDRLYDLEVDLGVRPATEAPLQI